MMYANAMELMIAPIVRGICLVLALGAAGLGLSRMIGALAAGVTPVGDDFDPRAPLDPARREWRPIAAADAD